MENEIKRLEKNRSVTIVVMLVIMLAIVLSACTVSAGGEPHVKSKSEKAIEQAKIGAYTRCVFVLPVIREVEENSRSV